MQAQAEARTGSGGRKGASPELGSGTIQRVLVTTSRLQKLVRGIFSRLERGAQASLESREQQLAVAHHPDKAGGCGL